MVYLNALSESLPECDRKTDMITLDKMNGLYDVCTVYCAKSSCNAAEQFVETNHAKLDQHCEEIKVYKEGALAMPQSELVNGEVCHRKIQN